MRVSESTEIPKMRDYYNKVSTMTDKELYDECSNKIWLSAYANNNPHSDYHWHVDVCYRVCYERKKPLIYSDAYRTAYKSAIGTDPYSADGDYSEVVNRARTGVW